MAQNWWVNDDGLNFLPGNATTGGGGFPGMSASGAVQMRSPLDAARAAGGKLGQAEYPDGYLGTINWDRQQDKMVQAVKNQMTAQSYQRGVHKGSRVDPSSYSWPTDFNPYSGLEREGATARIAGQTIEVQKFAPSLNPVERLAHQGRTSGMASPEQLGQQMAEARKMGVDPAINPVVPPDSPRGVFVPKYRIALSRRMDRVGDYESGK